MRAAVILTFVCLLTFLLVSCSVKDNPEHTGMPDPEYIRKQKTIKKVNVVYGEGETVVTLRKPDNAYFDIPPAAALDTKSRVSLRAEDLSWRAEIFSIVCDESSEDFAQYYYNGNLPDLEKRFEYYNQEVTDLRITHMNKPVNRITTTYKPSNDENTYEVCFVGFEFEDSLGKGLMGFKIYSLGKELSDKFLKGLFNELFFIER